MEPGVSRAGRVGPVITVRFWAGARAAVGLAEEEYDGPATLEALRRSVLERHPDPKAAAVLSVCSVLVDGGQASGPEAVVEPGAIVEFLPPFAGG